MLIIWFWLTVKVGPRKKAEGSEPRKLEPRKWSEKSGPKKVYPGKWLEESGPRKWANKMNQKSEPEKWAQERRPRKLDPSFFSGKKWCRFYISFKRFSHSTVAIKPPLIPPVSEALYRFCLSAYNSPEGDSSFNGWRFSQMLSVGKNAFSLVLSTAQIIKIGLRWIIRYRYICNTDSVYMLEMINTIINTDIWLR